MAESYVLHDVMRKVKADGLFDSIRRDLLADIEQKSSYLDLKSNIETLMSSYLTDHKWSSGLKKSELREQSRRHIEASSLIKETLPSLVSQHMQTCQQQLVQSRLSTFVSDHLEHVYHSIGTSHGYQQPYSTTVSTPYVAPDKIKQEPVKTISQEKKQQQPSVSIKKEPTTSNSSSNNKSKTPTHMSSESSNKKSQPSPSTSSVLIKKKIPSAISTQDSKKEQQQSGAIVAKKKPPTTPTIPVKEEKKRRIPSPLHSPNDLVDISPSPPSVDNERYVTSSGRHVKTRTISPEPQSRSPTPSPPPPIVRIASPLRLPSNSISKKTPVPDLLYLPPSTTSMDTVSPHKMKRVRGTDDENGVMKKKVKQAEEELEGNKSISDGAQAEEMIPSSSARSNETDTRKLRPRRPNPKYSKEQFEISSDVSVSDPMSPPPTIKPKKIRPWKSVTTAEQEKESTTSNDHSLETPSSPLHMEPLFSAGNMSPEYGTSLLSPVIDKQENEVVEILNTNSPEQLRTQSPQTTRQRKSTSPRRLRPRKANERPSTTESHGEQTADSLERTSSKSREIDRRRSVTHATEQTAVLVERLSGDDDGQSSVTRKSRQSSGDSSNSSELPGRSISAPDNLNTPTDESQTARPSPPTSTPVSKSFIWKPKISK